MNPPFLPEKQMQHSVEPPKGVPSCHPPPPPNQRWFQTKLFGHPNRGCRGIFPKIQVSQIIHRGRSTLEFGRGVHFEMKPATFCVFAVGLSFCRWFSRTLTPISVWCYFSMQQLTSDDQKWFTTWRYISPQTLRIEMGLSQAMEDIETNFKVCECVPVVRCV